MLIEIHCGNFSNFDAALGRYVECGEKLIVSSDQVGQFVTCTKCKQQVEVPYDVGAASKTRHEDGTTRQSAAQKPKQAPPSNSASSASAKEAKQKRRSQPSGEQKSRTSKPKPVGSSPGTRRPSKGASANPAAGNVKPTSRRTLASPIAKKSASGVADPKSQKKRRPAAARFQKSDVMSMEFGDQNVSSTVSEDRMERCKKCGNIVANGQCTMCKYVEPKFEKLHQPLENIEIELAGFQRWFCQTINEGVSVRILEYGSHAMLGLLGVFLLTAAFLSIFGFGIGTTGGIVMLIVVCAAAMLYVGLIYKGRQFLRDPNARLAWFQRPFWNVMLGLARMMKWEAYDGRLKDRKIIKVHERMFRDHEIPGLEGIKSCQVLDLQGTHVSDLGLLDLYGLKYLQCVVLKRTNVTHEGVFRLQQSFPRLWIWY